jgi:hypothetical protein
MQSPSWAGSERQRRQEPPKAPSPYAGEWRRLNQVSEPQGTVRWGESVEIRTSDDEPWQKHKTRKQLTIFDHTIEGDSIIFRAYGWQVRVKRTAVALPKPPKRSRWKL